MTAFTDHLDPRAETWARTNERLADPTYRERQIAMWRELGRHHLAENEMDLAKRCEGFAIWWEDRP